MMRGKKTVSRSFFHSLAPFLTGLRLVALPASTQSVQPEPDRGVWRTAAPAPTKRTEVAAAVLNGKIYVVGGFERPSLGNVMNLAITPSLEAYDPSTDRWMEGENGVRNR
jgi:hypothetical protein